MAYFYTCNQHTQSSIDITCTFSLPPYITLKKLHCMYPSVVVTEKAHFKAEI